MKEAIHAKAVELFKNSVDSGDKVKRNASKLAFIDATRRFSDSFISLSADLERYERDAAVAAKEFSEFVFGWSTEEIVKVIKDAG